MFHKFTATSGHSGHQADQLSYNPNRLHDNNHQHQQNHNHNHHSTAHHPTTHFPVLIPPYTVLLKDGETTATIYPIHNTQQLPPGLLAFLADEFNMEIERGDTFPFFDTLDIEEFKNYWFGSFAAVMVLGDDQQLDHQRSWEKECLGSFFIKPNFPGRSSHICTGGFLVNAGIRGKGIGKTLCECYLDWAPKLGYTSSVFNLIFETNVGARRIFESLNFKRIGKIKAAGILKEHENAVDAIIYGKELVQPSTGDTYNNQGTYRFDKIKYYLETGRYPPLIDRQEKSRLRSSASHYKLIDGKLTLNGREVISDPVRQLEICTEFHQLNHGGINKTTSSITERFHWTRIKDTVAQAIRNCNECRDPTKSISNLSRRKNSSPPGASNHTHHPSSNKSSRNSSSLDLPSHNGYQTHQQQSQTNSNSDIESLSQHLQRTDPSLLQASDFQNLDDPSGILAVVEAAQRRNQHQQQHHHHHNHQHDTQQTQDALIRGYEPFDSINEVRVNGGSQTHSNTTHGDNEIPVDPEVSAFDEVHNQQYHHDQQQQSQDHQNQYNRIQQQLHRQQSDDAGDEIEIARALIQANDVDVDGDGTVEPDRDEQDMFR